ncbi:MAG: RNA polymerase sigma factor, partial [Roseimicrobium sp.]
GASWLQGTTLPTMNDRELERLYDAYASGVFRYLVTFTKTEADARDLLQDLFIKLACGTTQESWQSEKAWLYRLAHNLAVDWLRRRKVRRATEVRLLQELADGCQLADDPDARLLGERFTDALRSLPAEQGRVMHLKLCDGLTFEEIAEAQGIPINTAASRYRYALEKLRALLRPLYEELT